MAIQFDTTKAKIFRGVDFGNENAIANLDGKGGLKTNGRYKLLGKLGRTDAERTNNNAVRTELLKSLGQAFGIAGMNEEGGKVAFSKDFMDRLEQILGSKVLKRGDFEIGADGTVKSGKPLTQRRITAIMTKATMAYRTNFDLGIYRQKLDAIKNELGLTGLEGEALEEKINSKPALNMFKIADDGLKMLEKHIFLPYQIDDPMNPGKKKTVYGPNNLTTDRSFMRVNPDYVDLKTSGFDADDVSMYQVRDPKSEIYKDFDKSEAGKILQKLMPGQVYHLERARSNWKTYEDLEKVKRYIFNTTQLVVQKMIDLYTDCKATGKLKDFMKFLANSPGACMEDKGEHLAKFEEKHFKVENPNEKPLSAAEIAELERLADMAVGDQTDKQINDVVNALYKSDPSIREKDDWDKDFADHVKSKLLGKNATIVTPVKNEERDQYEFKPVLDSKGNPVVRPLSNDDIDKIGRACLYNILG